MEQPRLLASRDLCVLHHSLGTLLTMTVENI